jgi:ribosomal protein S18 acetylase RimI-like enzyme
MVRSPSTEQPVDSRLVAQALPVRMMRIKEADLKAVGRLNATCYSPSIVGDEDSAIADMQASWAGLYGQWLQDCSLIAALDGRPIGAVLAVDAPHWDDVSDLVFVTELFTEPNHQRRGVGGGLLTASLQAIDADRAVGLRVQSANMAAVCLYRKLGFKQLAVADRESDWRQPGRPR